MALFVQKGVITAPTVDGNDTVLSGLTDPKAIILWGTPQTAEGTVDASQAFSQGWATYDGGAVQQYYNTWFSLDAAATIDAAGGHNNTACLKLFSATGSPPTTDCELRLVSMDSSSITLDWFNAPASAYLIHYLVIGGSDVTAARCGTFSLATTGANQDFTINAGFGNADLLLFSSRVKTALTDTSTDPGLMLGVDNGTQRACHCLSMDDGSAAVVMRDAQKAKAMVGILEASIDFEADWNPAGDPTDGFELSVTDLPSVTATCAYLALKGTFTSTVGVANAPTAAPTQTQNLTHSQAPKAALLWGRQIPTGTTIDTNHADLGGFRMFAGDGTNEGGAIVTDDDAAVDARGGNVTRTTKGMAKYVADTAGGAPIVRSTADTSISGSNFVLTWDDTDATSDEFAYLLLGDGAGGPTTYQKTGVLIAGAVLAGADSFQTAETGSLTTNALAAGADSFQPIETGVLAAGTVVAGADVATYAETGSLTTQALQAGADAAMFAETGSLTTQAFIAGADVAEYTRAGSVTTGAVVSGADAATFVEAGSITTNGLLAGVATTIAGTVYVKTGSVTMAALMAGTDSAERVETGSLTAGGLLAGADAHTATKVGSLLAGTTLAGADAATFVETGSLTTRAFLAGVGTTVLPDPWIEAGFSATSTLEGNTAVADLEGAFATSGVFE